MPMREEMHNLAQEIVGSYEARAAGITSLRKEVTAQRQATQAELRGLDKAHQAMARQLRADLAEGRSELAGSVASKLKELDAAQQAMARQQHADLAKGRSDLTQAEAQRKSEVNAWMKDVATAHAGARDEWQKMTATMQSKRGGVAVAVKPPIKERAERPVALRKQVFEYLANHPDGTNLVELAEEFGIARIQIGMVVRNLMDNNKVEKRGLRYFAV